MSLPMDLEYLKKAFADNKAHVAIVQITNVDPAIDFSSVLVECEVLGQARAVIANVAWDAQLFQLPQKDDLAVIVFPDGGHEGGQIIARLSNTIDIIPFQAMLGNLVLKSLSGKKLYISSDTKISIGKNTLIDASEPLVLGDVLKSCLGDLLDAFLDAPSIGTSAVGPVFLDPGIRVLLTLIKSVYLTSPTTNIVSQIAYTERGVI